MRFNELSQKAQERAVQDFVGGLDFMEVMQDAISAHEEMLAEEGWLEPTVYVDVSDSQGAGACFEFTGIDFMKLWDNKRYPLSLETTTNISNGEIDVDMYAKKCGRYCHEYSVSFGFDIYPFMDCSCVNLLQYDVEEILQQAYRSRCGLLYAHLKLEREETTSFDHVADMLIDGEFEFNEKGERK